MTRVYNLHFYITQKVGRFQTRKQLLLATRRVVLSTITTTTVIYYIITGIFTLDHNSLVVGWLEAHIFLSFLQNVYNKSCVNGLHYNLLIVCFLQITMIL